MNNIFKIHIFHFNIDHNIKRNKISQHRILKNK